MSTLKYATHAAVAVLCLVGAAATPGADSRTQSFARLPDWSGQWQIEDATPSATGGIEESLDDVLQTMKKWGPPPYNPEARAVFDQFAAQLHKGAEENLKTGRLPQGVLGPTCTFGFPALMIDSPLMFEILTTPKETALIFSGRETRHVYTDGRPHTPPEDLFPTFWGDSVGHWEGQTLVIDTIAVTSPPDGRRPPAILALGGVRRNADVAALDAALVAVFSPAARFVERIRMLDRDHLEDEMTVIDPQVFTAPWRMTRRYSRVTRLNRMIHEDCEGEERNPIVNGEYTIAPPPPDPPPLPPPFGPAPTSTAARQ